MNTGLRSGLRAIRVRLRKPLSKGAPFALFFSLLFLAGLGASLYHAATGDPSFRGGYLIIATFGLVFGGSLGFIASLLLPREVVVDWSSREIRVVTWFSKRVVAFDEIARLELEAKRVEVPSGESGSNTRFGGRRCGRFVGTKEERASLPSTSSKRKLSVMQTRLCGWPCLSSTSWRIL